MVEPLGDAQAFLALYDRALPIVYGYLLSRCRDQTTAEDLTSETFLACVTTADRATSIPWIVGVARHKLVDHWRKRERDQRALAAVGDERSTSPPDGELPIDESRAGEILTGLAVHHRAALTLRYVDGLSVPEVADVLGRTVHATEALLVRARAAFRKAYETGGSDA